MFAKRLKRLREHKGINQIELANALNVAQGTVGNWETGKRMPDADMLIAIAKRFNVSVDYLLGYEGPEEEPDINEEIVILNRAAKKMTPEQQKKLLDMAKVMFKEEFDD